MAQLVKLDSDTSMASGLIPSMAEREKTVCAQSHRRQVNANVPWKSSNTCKTFTVWCPVLNCTTAVDLMQHRHNQPWLVKKIQLSFSGDQEWEEQGSVAEGQNKNEREIGWWCCWAVVFLTRKGRFPGRNRVKTWVQTRRCEWMMRKNRLMAAAANVKWACFQIWADSANYRGRIAGRKFSC